MDSTRQGDDGRLGGRILSLLLLCCVALLGCTTPLPVVARVSGRVLFNGEFPLLKRVTMKAEPYCVDAVGSETLPEERALRDSEGGLANVLVFVSDGHAGRLPDGLSPELLGEVLLDARQCAFTPRVLGVRARQSVVMTNHDDVMHRFHPNPTRNRGHEPGMPNTGREQTFAFRNAERPFRVMCDVHVWERAWIGVFDHPWFAVTDEHGVFELPEGLEPGAYTLTAWHEVLGERTYQLIVSEGEAARLVELNY